jgi:hypothetical protein
MDNIGSRERRKAHSTIRTITLIFTYGERKFATSWVSFYDTKSMVMAHLAMTWSVCKLTDQNIYMGEFLMRYINAISGITGAMKLHADHMGEVFAMSLLTEPRVSYTGIITLTREYIWEKGGDTEWMKLMEY